jgi:hypothetical protein
MASQRRSVVRLGAREHASNHFSLPIDTQVKPGIYSPRLEFSPLVSGAAGVADGTKGTNSNQFEGLARSRSFKQTQLCLEAAWRAQAPGNEGAPAFHIQNGRLEFDFRQAWGTGSLLPQNSENPLPPPDLPCFQREQHSSEGWPCDLSDIPCFLVLRHGKDFNAIRRGQ